MLGRTVQHYQFIEKLGAGGMGDIFKAQDTRLNRMVAVKVLSGPNASDPERRRRFLQEAQAASALNHPNIITIHDILNDGDNALMVMEWVQGKTLVDLIPKGGLRVPQVIKYGVQMADALQVAHNAGIVHRDLKPGNVMVTDSGLVKILDFGLAKLTDRQPLGPVSDATQTIADAPLTVEGSIIGTVSYMSPEQAQGRKVDTRSDIFSFGVVLYEMATGARAFAGESALSTLSSILRDEARPILEIAPDVPIALEQVVHRCLRKSPDDRWQSMKEVQMAFATLKRESDSGSLYGFRPIAPQAPAASAVVPPSAAPMTMPPQMAPSQSLGQGSTGQPGFSQPGGSQPGFGQPGFGQPSLGQPGSGQSNSGQTNPSQMNSGILPPIAAPPSGIFPPASGTGLPGSGPSSGIPPAGLSPSGISAMPPGAPAKRSGLSAPVIASMAGGLVFVLVAGIGGVWFMKHRQQAAPSPEPAPIAQLAPEPEPAPAAEPAPPAVQELTNDNVIDMVAAKVPVTLILSQIRSSKTNFNLTSTEVIRLSKAGVPANVIDVMRDPKKTPVVVASTPTTTPAAQTKSQKSAPAPTPAPVAPPPPVQTAAAPVAPPVAVVEPPPVSVAAPVKPVPQTRMVAAPNGTPFSIVLAEDVPSAAEEGTPLRFTVKEDFKIDDTVVIAKGAPVTGAIVEGSKKKFIVSTKMTMRLIEATGIDGNKIKLRATSAAKTDGPPTRPVETGAKRPKDMAAAAGTEYIAYIDGAQAVPGRK